MTPLSPVSSSSQCYDASDDEPIERAPTESPVESTCARMQKYIPSGFAAYRAEFYRANLLWDSDKKIYLPNYPLNFIPIQEAIQQGIGLPLLTQITRNLFFGSQTVPKVAALAYAVLDYAIELGFKPAITLLQEHRTMGFGLSEEGYLVTTLPVGFWVNTSHYLEDGFAMYHASRSERVGYLNAAANILALDRRIRNLRLSLPTRSITADISEPLMRVIKTIQSSPYLERLAITKLFFSGSLEKNPFIHELVMILGTPEENKKTLQNPISEPDISESVNDPSETAVVMTNKIEHLSFSFKSDNGDIGLALFLSCMAGLATNTTLQSLNLENRTPVVIPPTSQDFKNEESMIIRSLRENLTLTTFCLSRFRALPDQLFQAFSRGMLGNKTLQILSFDYTDLSLVKDCSTFGYALAFHPSLYSICFRGTKLRSPEPIILALSNNMRVTDLNMSLIEASDTTGLALAKMLSVNSSLIDLSISGNRFTDDTVIKIAQALTQNTTLGSLEFSRVTELHSPQQEFYDMLASWIGLNGSLTHCKCDIDIAFWEMLRNDINKNTRNTRMLTTLLKDIENISLEGVLQRGPTRRLSVTE